MKPWLLFVLFCLALPAGAAAINSTTECIGPEQAKDYVIYLHGLTPPQQKTVEEGENQEILERLAKDFSLRIAMPRANVCATGKLCWLGRDPNEVLETFRSLREHAQTCWTGNPKYSVIGFSNGGYFAFKLYKIHQDAQLTRIIASGSAGTWENGTDKANPYSNFALMIGNQDITFKVASHLADTLRKSLPNFIFETFSGKHRLDYDALAKILKKSKKT